MITKAMIQSPTQPLSVEQFIQDYGDNDQIELIDGELVLMEPTGLHEQVVALIGQQLNVLIASQKLPYFLPHRCLLKFLGTETAYRPDLIVIDQTELRKEPLWRQEPVITFGSSVKLIVEVVSKNWQNDYARKAEDYALFGVGEYWIVDYLGVGGRDYIGRSKQPSITICRLDGDEYQKQLFRNDEQLISPLFPSLELTAEQIFRASQL
jgi:Uma2 family endonuclease